MLFIIINYCIVKKYILGSLLLHVIVSHNLCRKNILSTHRLLFWVKRLF